MAKCQMVKCHRIVGPKPASREPRRRCVQCHTRMGIDGTGRRARRARGAHIDVAARWVAPRGNLPATGLCWDYGRPSVRDKEVRGAAERALHRLSANKGE